MSSRRGRIVTVAASILLLGVAVIGVLTRPPASADRAYQLEQRLRCPVCSSVSIAESGSDTAAAMRRTVAEQIATGRSDAQIVGYFRARYGDWVLLDPPARGVTMLVWVLPVAAALLGVAVIAGRRPRPPPELSDTDRARVVAALQRTRSADRGEQL